MKRRVFYRLGLILLVISIAGCGSDHLDDLRGFVRDAHKDRKPRIEPLPEVKTYESFVYSAEDGIDPFAQFNLKPRGTSTAGGPSPNLHRRKEPLEDYPLDSLKMVGTLSRGNENWAVIQAPDGTVHRTQIGNHMGQNFGKVLKINDEKVELVELIQDPLGEWIERKASRSIE